MSKPNKTIIKKYSNELTKSLFSNIEKSTEDLINLQSEIIDLNYSKNDINLKLRCKILIDDRYYKISGVCDYLPLYFEQLSIKNNYDQDLYYNNKYEAKYRNLTKAQVKYLAYSDQLIVKENLNQKLYGMEDNYVTLLGDKTMYDKDLLFKTIQSNVYKTINSKLKKVIKQL